MTKIEALEILATGNSKMGLIDDAEIWVVDRDIASNLEQNGYELDLEYIQDFTRVYKNGNCELFQGHSLSEIELKP
jgi:hypothetical protein